MDANTILNTLALIGIALTLYYTVRSFHLQQRLASKYPDIRIFLGQQKPETVEPINVFGSPTNVATTPRPLKIFAVNKGTGESGPYRLSIYLPHGIEMIASSTVLQGEHSVMLAGEQYDEAVIDSNDGIELVDTPRLIAQFQIRGLTTQAIIRWKFKTQDYETHGHIKVALN